MVDGNKLGNAGFQYLGVPYSRMDCQAFVEQCLRDCGKNITDAETLKAQYPGSKIEKE